MVIQLNLSKNLKRGMELDSVHKSELRLKSNKIFVLTAARRKEDEQIIRA